MKFINSFVKINYERFLFFKYYRMILVKNNLKIIILLFSIFFCSACSEKISYSGKIINLNNDSYSTLNNKKEVIENFGQPSFIDLVDKKYYYFKEKRNTKNFFKDITTERRLIVINFNNDETINFINEFNLEDQNQIKIIKEQTSNQLVKQGLLEKIFGGVGRAPTSQ